MDSNLLANKTMVDDVGAMEKLLPHSKDWLLDKYVKSNMWENGGCHQQHQTKNKMRRHEERNIINMELFELHVYKYISIYI